jgi:hypothetical protein
MEIKKNPMKSKTLWVNAIVAILAFFPAIGEKFDSGQIMMLMGVVNMVLRMVTKDKIGLE